MGDAQNIQCTKVHWQWFFLWNINQHKIYIETKRHAYMKGQKRAKRHAYMNYKGYDKVIWAPLIWSLYVLWTKAAILPLLHWWGCTTFPLLLRTEILGNKEQRIRPKHPPKLRDVYMKSERVCRNGTGNFIQLSECSDHDSFFRFRKWCCVVWLSSHFFSYVCYKLFLPKRSKREKTLC